MKKLRRFFLPAFLLPKKKKKMRRHAESSASSSSSSGANKSATPTPTSKASSKNATAGAASKFAANAPSTGGGGDAVAAAGGSENTNNNNVGGKKSGNATSTSADSKGNNANSTNLSKTYLSKSHDNLASTLRRKANSGQGQGTVLSSRSQKASSKDDLKSTGASKESKEGKDAKGPGVGLSSSTTAISGAGLSGHQPAPRASHRTGVPRKVSSQSASSSNAAHAGGAAAAMTSSTATAPSSVTLRNRRGVDKRTRVTPLMPSLQVAASEPVAQTLNDGERRCFEQQISELVQNAETKKAEIASQKIEIRHLKEQVESSKSKEENFLLIQNENALLRAKLQEAGVSVDLITDAEKENLLRTPTEDVNSCIGDEETSHSQAATRGESEEGKDSQDAVEGDSSEGGHAGRGIMMVNAMVSGMTGMLSALPPNLDNKSIEGLSLDESNGWEKQSSDALSEVSVANLQDRIIQMEETHYSTSEELQATLQELSDLQDSLADLTAENERLNEEKDVLVESLLAQTEKLEREREERMKVLLFHNIHSDANGGEAGAASANGAGRGPKSPSGSGLLSDREQQLMDLIKAAHGETEELRAKQRELTTNLRAAEQENKELSDVMAALKDKIHLLEARSESMYADKRENERRLGDAKETVTSQRMELNKMAAMLESASERCATFQKLVESQIASSANNSPEGSDASDEAKIQLENAKREQENTLATLAATREKLSESEGMTARLRDKVTNLEQMLKESGDNAKAQVSDLEYQLANATLEKSKMKKDLDSLKSHVMEVERSCEKYIEEKAEYSITIGNLEDEVEKTTNRCRELEGELEIERRQRQEEQDEWAQFQQDLQTVVVVANDIRKEAQEEMEKTAMENTNLKEKLNQLQAELEKTAASSAKGGSVPGSGVTSPVGRASSPSSLVGGVSPSPPESTLMSPSPLSPSEIRGRVQSYLSTAVASRGNQKRHDAKTSLSVKDLIQSIEGKNNDAGATAAKEPGEGDDSLDGVAPLDAGMTSPTPPMSGSSSVHASSPGSSGHNSLSMMRSQGAIPKNNAEGTMGLKGVLKRNVNEFSHRSSPVGTHRSAIKTSTPDTDDAKCREISSRAAGASTGPPGAPPSSVSSDAASSSVASRSKPTTLTSSSSLSATTTANSGPTTASIPSISSILMNSSSFRRNSYSDKPESRDPLAALAKQYGASKRNALLKYVQNRTAHYPGIDITNFSSSWNDGMAFCALVHTYLPEKIPYYELSSLTKRRNFELAFSSAEEVGVAPILNINDMVSIERPDWQQVMAYVTSIYKHFET